MRHFRNYLTDAFSGELEKCSLTIPKEFILNHVVCDFAETVRWRVNHDAYSAEKIGRFFFATTALLRREKI